MTEIKAGQAYVARRVYTGRNENGPWEILVVQSPGTAEPRVAISPMNVPCGVGANGVFKVTKIHSVTSRKRKARKPCVWMEGSVTVKATVKALAQLQPEEIEQISEINYSEVQTEFPSLEELFK